MNKSQASPNEIPLAGRRQFSRYKDSEPSVIPFVDRLPSHWRTEKLKHIASVRFSSVNKKSEDGEEPVRLCNYTDVYKSDTIVDDPDFMQATASKAEIVRFTLKKGDVLITKDSEAWNDIAVPAYVTADMPGVLCGYHLAHIRPNPERLDGAFLSRAFAANGIREQFHVAANGITRYGLPNRAIAGALFPVPPLDEQRAIAAFLDRETAKIDKLVETKLALLSRLKEKNASQIFFVLTHGITSLNARRKVKPAGVPWLDDIPEHWEMVPIKYLAEIGNGSTPSRENPQYWNDGRFPWLNSSVVNQELVTEATEYVSDLAMKECHLPRIKPPAVLVGITGEGRTRGMATTLLFEATINQHMAYLRPKASRCSVPFLRRVLDLAYRFLRDESDGGGSTKGAITCEQLGNLRIPLPPLAEQREILCHLDADAKRMTSLMSKVELAVRNLKQLRASLISSSVTGQIDVRNYRPEAPCQ